MKQSKENYESFYQWMERCKELGFTIKDDGMNYIAYAKDGRIYGFYNHKKIVKGVIYKEPV